MGGETQKGKENQHDLNPVFVASKGDFLFLLVSHSEYHHSQCNCFISALKDKKKSYNK